MRQTAKSPPPSVKRCQEKPLLGTEPHNALPTGFLTFDRFLAKPPPIRVAGSRYCSVLRMSLIKLNPCIQRTTGRKAGDLLTFTLFRRWRIRRRGSALWPPALHTLPRRFYGPVGGQDATEAIGGQPQAVLARDGCCGEWPEAVDRQRTSAAV
jgi:hypothetical protein